MPRRTRHAIEPGEAGSHLSQMTSRDLVVAMDLVRSCMVTGFTVTMIFKVTHVFFFYIANLGSR